MNTNKTFVYLIDANMMFVLYYIYAKSLFVIMIPHERCVCQ